MRHLVASAGTCGAVSGAAPHARGEERLPIFWVDRALQVLAQLAHLLFARLLRTSEPLDRRLHCRLGHSARRRACAASSLACLTSAALLGMEARDGREGWHQPRGGAGMG